MHVTPVPVAHCTHVTMAQVPAQSVVKNNGSVIAINATHQSRSDTTHCILSSHKVMSEISQIVRSVIRFGIRVSTMRNQRKVRSLSMSQNEIKSRKKTARKFN
eukprot:3522484-Amphidinium_carterae.1